MISIRDLTVAYIPNSPTLNGLSVQFEAAKIHAIVGLNGSGKTTLLNTIYKLIKPKHGDILYNNMPINQRQIAYLPTENFFYSNITGAEYLALFRNPHFDLAAWNALFKLSLDTSIDTYSTGMRKKLAILSVLKQEKPILILDEPFNGLDIETNRILHLILLKLKEKTLNYINQII